MPSRDFNPFLGKSGPKHDISDDSYESADGKREHLPSSPFSVSFPLCVPLRVRSARSPIKPSRSAPSPVHLPSCPYETAETSSQGRDGFEGRDHSRQSFISMCSHFYSREYQLIASSHLLRRYHRQHKLSYKPASSMMLRRYTELKIVAYVCPFICSLCRRCLLYALLLLKHHSWITQSKNKQMKMRPYLL